MTNDRILTRVTTLGGNDPWAQGQSFMTVEQLQAEIATLREALKEAKDGLRYWEPQTAHGAREMARICALVDAALQPKEGNQ